MVDVSCGLARRVSVSHARRLGLFVAALVVILLLALVPLLGALLLFVSVLLGLGALNLGLYRAYVGQ